MPCLVLPCHAVLCCAEPAIAYLGAMQSMFEASMYSFVFLWTMALSPNKEAIKHGLIFVNFMTACMAGSFLSSVLMKSARPEKYMKGVFAVATGAMLVPMLLALDTTKDPSKGCWASCSWADPWMHGGLSGFSKPCSLLKGYVCSAVTAHCARQLCQLGGPLEGRQGHVLGPLKHSAPA